MIKKTFILTQFGSPHPWTQQYIDNVQRLGQFGFEWKIFTPNALESKGNVEIIKMDCEGFNELVEKKLGVRPKFFVTATGVPSVHITEYYVFSGLIFEDYLKGSDFWGTIGLDIVFGRLERFVQDNMLELCDVFTDDVAVVNGTFSLWRNTPMVNELCLKIHQWEEKLTQAPCPRCMGVAGANHTLVGTDEYDMAAVMVEPEVLAKVRYIYPPYYPIHSHDRLEQHVPDVKLSLKPDGSLWELSKDVAPPDWPHARPMIGREIPYFHFIRTKCWPELRP